MPVISIRHRRGAPEIRGFGEGRNCRNRLTATRSQSLRNGRREVVLVSLRETLPGVSITSPAPEIRDRLGRRSADV